MTTVWCARMPSQRHKLGNTWGPAGEWRFLFSVRLFLFSLKSESHTGTAS
jgi:hypothetical protein